MSGNRFWSRSRELTYLGFQSEASDLVLRMIAARLAQFYRLLDRLPPQFITINSERRILPFVPTSTLHKKTRLYYYNKQIKTYQLYPAVKLSAIAGAISFAAVRIHCSHSCFLNNSIYLINKLLSFFKIHFNLSSFRYSENTWHWWFCFSQIQNQLSYEVIDHSNMALQGTSQENIASIKRKPWWHSFFLPPPFSFNPDGNPDILATETEVKSGQIPYRQYLSGWWTEPQSSTSFVLAKNNWNHGVFIVFLLYTLRNNVAHQNVILIILINIVLTD